MSGVVRLLLVCLFAVPALHAQAPAASAPPSAGEAAHYAVDFLAPPAGETIEVGGMEFLPDGRLAVSTRRGRVWIVENPTAADPGEARFHLFADGLHEGLGLKVAGDVIYVLQRGELSRLVDADGDGRAERVEVVSQDWGMTGNYHEFAFGLPRDEEGGFYVALNLGFWDPRWWHGKARAPGRGAVLRIAPTGEATTWALGFRSPNGLALSPDHELFLTDNQGDWLPAGPLYHVRRGRFYGHPASLQWTEEYRREGREASDTEPPDWERTPAAVWFPYDLSRSGAGLAWDVTQGRFGPFPGQLFVAELTNGLVVRVCLEKVRGEYQGACICFRRGVGCANRLAFARDGTLMVGLTERGWGGAGRPNGISRVRFTGVTPMEMQTVSLVERGFEVRFTLPLAEAVKPEQIRLTQYAYNWWWKYGSPETDEREVPVESVETSQDRSRIIIAAPALAPGMVARAVLSGVTASNGLPLLHERFDYTVNQLGTGPFSTKKVAVGVPPPPTREEELEGWLNVSDGYTMDGWTGTGWRPGNVSLPEKDPTRFHVENGPHAYVNPDPASGATTDLATRYEHGDVSAVVEFCLPRGGVSGVSFMGRYEVLLGDCWDEKDPSRFACGMIPGLAHPGAGWSALRPPENHCQKPGEWQRLEVEFRAPRFDAAGRKTARARFESIRLNDHVLFEGIELPGPTEGCVRDDEASRGPLVLRGTRGQAAFRMVRIRPPDWNAREGEGWRSVIGADLAAWKPAGWARWKLEGGVLTGSGERGLIFGPPLEVPPGPLHLAVRAQVRANGGGRGALILGGAFDDRAPGGLRLVIDSNGKGPERTGSLEGVAPVLTHLVPWDAWCQLEAEVEEGGGGLRVRVRLNGILVTDARATKQLARPLRIACEQDGGPSILSFCNLQVHFIP